MGGRSWKVCIDRYKQLQEGSASAGKEKFAKKISEGP